jgi:hypothetical protein
MRFASCLLKADPGKTTVIVGVLALLAVHGVARAEQPSSFVYCMNQGGAKILAGQVAANGDLRFGLSVWSSQGNNISVFGTAARQGQGWDYSDAMRAPTPDARCHLTFTPAAEGAFVVQPDPAATCRSRGGANTEIDAQTFPHAALEGPVTTELRDSEAFQKAGRCVGKSG